MGGDSVAVVWASLAVVASAFMMKELMHLSMLSPGVGGGVGNPRRI